MNKQRQQEIRKREQEASRGPWKNGWVNGDDMSPNHGFVSESDENISLGGTYFREDRVFIVHARQDIPDLLDALEARDILIEELVRVNTLALEKLGLQGPKGLVKENL